MEEITVRDKKYIMYQNEEGSPSLKRYNDKYKMWVEINFSTLDNNVENELIETLSKVYTRSFK